VSASQSNWVTPQFPQDPSALTTQQTDFPADLDPNGGYLVSAIPGSLEHDQIFAQYMDTIPQGKMSTYSELMPHVVAQE
jgi:hypothetical protein